jgi:hypothetical protein
MPPHTGGTWLGLSRSVDGGNDLGCAPWPHRSQVGGSEHADHGVGPAQPLRQALLPLVPDADAVVDVPVEEGLVAVVDQPSVHFAGQRGILARG